MKNHALKRQSYDAVIVGADRVAANGDVANKIGTYMVAVLARRHGIPFYVAAPLSTIDPETPTGDEIPIEERDPREVSHIYGMSEGVPTVVSTTAEGTPVSNFAFDVTPARLVTGLITERGICDASESGLLSLFPEPHRS